MNLENEENLPVNVNVSLRNYVGSCYLFVEELFWCDGSKHFQVEHRDVTDTDNTKANEVFVPIASARFDTEEAAEKAVKQTKKTEEYMDISVYDMHYRSEDKTLVVAFEPFKI